ncbi:MAG: family FMN-dependent class oxidoreductase [Devosia sp.]|nr:family FMN-dependent class oxidoreductase [Devosia sp.]
MQIGYHASHEQFSPSQLLALVQQAQAAGFSCAKASDHFHPWSERQGHSGFTWSWLGAAMAVTDFPIGSISAPGYRYHPAIVAQAAATLGEMFPNRFWLALGSGEALNEAITGTYWPDKPERNAILAECAAVIRALFAGETVTHRGRVTVVEAKLYSRPAQPVPLLGAAITPASARHVAQWADGLLITGGDVEEIRPTIEAFRENGGAGKPVHIQHALCWAKSEDEAFEEALDQWSANVIGGEVNWDLRRPIDFDNATRFVRREDIAEAVFISADLGRHRAAIEAYAELGANAVHLHQVGRNQAEFIDAFGAKVLPGLDRNAAGAR